jgi:hypothetical protein
MRNYWALLPVIAVCVVLALVYAVPTLVNPQLVSNVAGLFRRDDEAAPAPLTPKERRYRRLGAVTVLLVALVLVGFNVSLNREANGCYEAAKAWGADDSREYDDPCINQIMGAYFSSPDGKVLEDNPQPVAAYQLVRGNKPKYIRWVQNRPSYDEADLIVGAPFLCDGDVKFTENDEKVMIVADITEPCPSRPQIGLVTIDLEKPLGDRLVVTVDDEPMKQVDYDMPSWGAVLKRLATGG